MSAYIANHRQSTVAAGRKVLIAFLTDVYDTTERDREIEAIVDFLLLKDYLSPTFFESVEEEV